MFGVGDDVREAPGTDREDLSGFFGGVAERVESGTSLGAEDEVARSQLLFGRVGSGRRDDRSGRRTSLRLRSACASASSGASGASSYSVAPILASSGRQKTRCRVPSSSSYSVPCVGEQVLTSHSVDLQVVAVARSVRGRLESSLGACANHARQSPRLTAISSPDPRQDRNVRRLRCGRSGRRSAMSPDAASAFSSPQMEKTFPDAPGESLRRELPKISLDATEHQQLRTDAETPSAVAVERGSAGCVS